MGLFKKKKPEDTPGFKAQMAKKIASHRLRYLTEREGETDIIIGRDGGFNIRGDEFRPLRRCVGRCARKGRGGFGRGLRQELR